jgi:hypothetical protein
LESLARFIGTWKLVYPDSIAAKRPEGYTQYAWDLKRSVIESGEFERRSGRLERYVRGLIAWNPVTETIEYQEHADWGNFVRGEIRIVNDTIIHRYMMVHYPAGAVRRWRITWRYTGGDTVRVSTELLDEGGWKPFGAPYQRVRVLGLPPG